ncbi:MAG: diacylglycerol kinase family protein [Bacteroidaceae bacterium]
MNEKWGIIYHSRAGANKTSNQWEKILQYLAHKNVAYDYFQSEGYGSVERLAGILTENQYTTLVIAGGDGALNDMINGIISHANLEQLKTIHIGIIPIGMSNDFASFWDITSDYRKAIDYIIAGRIRRIDVGRCTYLSKKYNKSIRRYFLNAVNIGLSEKMLRVIDQANRFWAWRLTAFFESLVVLFFEKKRYRMQLQIGDEQIKGHFMTVCIGNSQAWGQTPSAIPYNGYLDVSLIGRPLGWGKFIKGLWLLTNHQLLNLKEVNVYRGKKIRVVAARNANIDLDGRALGRHYPLDVDILHELINFIIP